MAIRLYGSSKQNSHVLFLITEVRAGVVGCGKLFGLVQFTSLLPLLPLYEMESREWKSLLKTPQNLPA